MIIGLVYLPTNKVMESNKKQQVSGMWVSHKQFRYQISPRDSTHPQHVTVYTLHSTSLTVILISALRFRLSSFTPPAGLIASTGGLSSLQCRCLFTSNLVL